MRRSVEGGAAIADVVDIAGRDPEWRDECGVFGVVGHAQAAQLTYYGMFALQHRGEESAGIVTVDGSEMWHHKSMGLVAEALPPEALAKLAHGDAAIGHVRYSTAGGSSIENAQPLVFRVRHGNMSLAHNGNLTNADELRHSLESNGAIFQSASDTEVVAHLIVRNGRPCDTESVGSALRQIRGGYALCVLSDSTLFAARDPHGLRPMVLGRIDGAWCVASESCALDAIGAEFERDVEPGELIVITRDDIRSVRFAPRRRKALCTFEHIYFARPDSDVDGHNVHSVRKRFGALLYEEHPADADIVIGVPDSSTSCAMGFASASGIPFDIGLIKSHYIGRSFTQPTTELRTQRVRLKLSPVRSVVAGKRVVMVDDSLVRGITSMRIVKLLRSAGASEVHVRIASPPVMHPCLFGIDTARRTELVAAHSSIDEIRRSIGADSLEFLSEPAMMRAFGGSGRHHGHCNACFTGRYPQGTLAEDTAHLSLPVLGQSTSSEVGDDALVGRA